MIETTRVTKDKLVQYQVLYSIQRLHTGKGDYSHLITSKVSYNMKTRRIHTLICRVLEGRYEDMKGVICHMKNAYRENMQYFADMKSVVQRQRRIDCGKEW